MSPSRSTPDDPLVASLAFEVTQDSGVDRLDSSDDDLADAIRAEGDRAAREGRPLLLCDYLDRIPGLPRRAVVLDAAIDAVLTSMSAGVGAADHAVRSLCESHPDLSDAIREAAALSRGLAAFELEPQPDAVSLSGFPSEAADFGPRLPDGRARYQLLERVGSGAHGVVYRAIDRNLSDAGAAAEVAIKVLSARLPRFRDRLRLAEEATKARRIDHPNVVRVLDRGQTPDGAEFSVSEYVAGGTLAQRPPQRSTKRWTRDVARLVADVARGVHAAHLAGLVHCDLKPSNILLTPAGVPKVADFGIAARLSDADADPLRGSFDGPLGGLAFIAPEQFRVEPGSRAIPADIYALGGLLYHLLSGKLPNGATIQEIERTLAPDTGRRQAPDPREADPAIDADLAAIAMRAMAPRPADRYPSAAQFADDLESWLAYRPLTLRRVGPVRRLTLWTRRNPRLAVAVVAALVGVSVSLGVGGYLLWLQRWLDGSRRHIETIAATFRNAGFETEALQHLWMLDQVAEVPILGYRQFDRLIWDNRIAITRDRIEHLRSAGQEASIECLTLETTLALWMLSDEQWWPDVQPLLETNQRKWHRVMTPDDPLRAMLAVLTDVALIKRAYFELRASHPPTGTRRQALLDDVRLAAARVEEALDAPLLSRYSRVRVLLLRSLRNAHTTKLLNDPPVRDRWHAAMLEAQGQLDRPQR